MVNWKHGKMGKCSWCDKPAVAWTGTYVTKTGEEMYGEVCDICTLEYNYLQDESHRGNPVFENFKGFVAWINKHPVKAKKMINGNVKMIIRG